MSIDTSKQFILNPEQNENSRKNNKKEEGKTIPNEHCSHEFSFGPSYESPFQNEKETCSPSPPPPPPPSQLSRRDHVVRVERFQPVEPITARQTTRGKFKTSSALVMENVKLQEESMVWIIR
ncbi:hypothetical protein CEXT_516751 [Caerostris extrusa]|uniref:Uncharacterized protein n=1 Tax=Caerostris extrusa TaxID=172846 RepID=A0AAV4V239_CAEEX|nr:hypothetical protein CEXT_516751 [Caerostris extrusa]